MDKVLPGDRIEVEIVKDSKCKCYGHGTRFLIHGRLKNAELRGCSNI